MATHIFNEHGIFKSDGKNLGILFRHAAKHGGVESIKVKRITNHKYEATVTVEFDNGWYGIANFVSFKHACDWANARSKNRGSWWTGCKVFIDERGEDNAIPN